MRRPIESTLSVSSHASAYESSSVVSADTEADSLSSSLLREEQETSIGTPADLQIARLEAEAARQLGKRRATKGRQSAVRKQAAVPVQVRCRAGQSCTVLCICKYCYGVDAVWCIYKYCYGVDSVLCICKYCYGVDLVLCICK